MGRRVEIPVERGLDLVRQSPGEFGYKPGRERTDGRGRSTKPTYTLPIVSAAGTGIDRVVIRGAAADAAHYFIRSGQPTVASADLAAHLDVPEETVPTVING